MVQATVVVPTANRLRNDKVVQVTQQPAVTKFVGIDGVVTSGAYKLGASVMMMASLVANVMLA